MSKFEVGLKQRLQKEIEKMGKSKFSLLNTPSEVSLKFQPNTASSPKLSSIQGAKSLSPDFSPIKVPFSSGKNLPANTPNVARSLDFDK